jgi:hypothetical protein
MRFKRFQKFKVCEDWLAVEVARRCYPANCRRAAGLEVVAGAERLYYGRPGHLLLQAKLPTAQNIIY